MEHIKILPYMMALVLLVFHAVPVSAQDMWQEAKESRIRLLVSGENSHEDMHGYEGLLQIELGDGWHSYWRAPGDAGIPLSLTPAENSGIAAIAMEWPTPIRYEDFGLMNFVYHEKVSFPLQITLAEDFETNESYSGDITVFYMVCKTVCVPQEFTLNLPKISSIDMQNLSANQAQMRFAERRLPYDGDVSDLGINIAVLSKDALVVAARASGGFDDVDLFVDAGDSVLLTAKPEVELQNEDPTRAMLKIRAPEDVDNLQALLQGQTVHMVLKNGKKAIKREFTF